MEGSRISLMASINKHGSKYVPNMSIVLSFKLVCYVNFTQFCGVVTLCKSASSVWIFGSAC